jgi:branched-chain amino acid transport system ATP-binding protein
MPMSRLLELSGVRSGYGRAEVIRGIDLHVDAGELVTIIGSNGAGKSTLLRTVVGLIKPTAGEIALDGDSIEGTPPERLVKRGVALVPEGRLLFGPMSVRENLQLGAYRTRGGGARALVESIARVYDLFPVLREREMQRAETLSGGEQQMLAVGRALMSDPRLLLLDEPSLGLAPKVIAQIFSALDLLRGSGVTILLVEQDARLALKHADRGYVMRTGSVVLHGDARDLLNDDNVKRIYLGSLKGEGST